MPKLPHDLDLTRRYREIDWVSEFQRLWAIFNHWLVAQTACRGDRDALEAFKREPRLHAWLDRHIAANAYPRPSSAADGYAGSYPQFAADNAISRFFRATQASPALATRISWHWRPSQEQRVRPIAAVTVSEDQFRALYALHARVLTEFMEVDLTLHQTLAHLGISATGCCFFPRVAPAAPAPRTTFASRLLALMKTEPQLAELVSLAEVTAPSKVSEDLMESLYNLRNVAMHGSLDFLVASDNAAARAGYDVLDLIIQDIRDSW